MVNKFRVEAKEKTFCGIDPGKSGAIVILNANQEIIFKSVMPVLKSKKSKPEYDIQSIIKIFRDIQPTFNYVEKAMLIPVSGKSAYYGNGFINGGLQFMLATLNLKYDIISPKRWQRNTFEGMPKADTKQSSILYAKRMQPKIDWRATERCKKDHDGLTDAYCLAVYCWKCNKDGER